jgi:2-hydroxy-6-oxonona-2,4-dienedioate hydrolase
MTKILAPTLIIWGSQDTVTPRWMGKKIAELIPHSSLSFIEDARHSPQFTHPRAAGKLVADFLLKSERQRLS